MSSSRLGTLSALGQIIERERVVASRQGAVEKVQLHNPVPQDLATERDILLYDTVVEIWRDTAELALGVSRRRP